jgi:hypothetical protein
VFIISRKEPEEFRKEYDNNTNKDIEEFIGIVMLAAFATLLIFGIGCLFFGWFGGDNAKDCMKGEYFYQTHEPISDTITFKDTSNQQKRGCDKMANIFELESRVVSGNSVTWNLLAIKDTSLCPISGKNKIMDSKFMSESHYLDVPCGFANGDELSIKFMFENLGFVPDSKLILTLYDQHTKLMIKECYYDK